jgi:hypothetical protein
MLTLSCSAEQARIAEEAGACAVMALERVPADIRRDGGVARMSDPKMIKEIMDAVSIPVMAKVRIGHFVEAQVPYTYLLGPLTYDRFLRQLELTTLMRVKCWLLPMKRTTLQSTTLKSPLFVDVATSARHSDVLP